MATLACPTLAHLKQNSLCAEQFAGLGDIAYVFLKDDLTAEPTVDATIKGFTALTFKEGKGAYQIDCKIDSDKIEGESLGKRKGFKNTLTLVIDRVDAETSGLMRAINNLEVGFIVPDGEDYQILYNPKRRLEITIKSDTGAKTDDDRNTTITAVSKPDFYPHMRLPAPVVTFTAPVTP